MSLNGEMFFKRTGRIESVQLKNEIFSVPYCNQVKEGTQYRKKKKEMKKKAVLMAGRQYKARKDG